MSSGSEKLKAEALLSKATAAEQRQDWDQAFQLYLKAAESFLSLYRSAPESAEYKNHAGRALERAEKIKAAKRNLTPVVVNPFCKDEQSDVLRASSRINGLLFPPWTEKTTESAIDVYQDAKQPDFSPEQTRLSASWRRAVEVFPEPSMISPHLLPDSILQNIVTDCSLCASLSVCLEHHRRFGSYLGYSVIYPQDANGTPRLTETGRYDIRLLLNGCHRRVVIDDKLPMHPNGTLLCMSTKGEPHLWPSLVEKAFMKVMGGYDFPGSNSSIDVHTLTGWIPEHIELKSPGFQHEKTWLRISTGFRTGQCVCTVGTGPQGGRWSGIDLPASHCYAVIDVGELDNRRTVSILSTWTLPLPGENTDAPPVPHQEILDMSWEDVCLVFDEICVNWDPRRFANKLELHGAWLPTNSSSDASQSSTRHLRLSVQRSTVGDDPPEVWVLISRHITDSSRKSDFMALHVDIEDHHTASPLGIDTVAKKGNFTNSPHILVRTRFPQSSSSTMSLDAISLFAAYEGSSERVRFTVTAYSSHPLAWHQAVSKAMFTSKVDGSLTIRNCGGNCTYPTFMINPQYHLCIRQGITQPHSSNNTRSNQKAQVTLALQGPKDIPFNLLIVWSHGQRIVELERKDIVANSGAYNYGFARLVAELPVGNYTVIASAFEPHHTGSFSLKAESSLPFDLKSISQEGAGMYNKTIRGKWDENSAMGSPSFGRYMSNPRLVVVVPSPTEVIIRLQLARPPTLSPLNITLFHDDSTAGQVATSGPYSDAISGVVIPRISLRPGKYWLIPSTYDPGVRADFRVIVYSTTPGVEICTKGR